MSYYKSQADVLYDPEKVSIEQMAKALGRYGYTAYPKSGQLIRITIPVGRIDGFEKIPLLEEALRKIPGVKGVKTEIMKQKIVVIAEPGKVKRERLVTTIKENGVKVDSQ